jgi:hypothetical protein
MTQDALPFLRGSSFRDDARRESSVIEVVEAWRGPRCPVLEALARWLDRRQAHWPVDHRRFDDLGLGGHGLRCAIS